MKKIYEILRNSHSVTCDNNVVLLVEKKTHIKNEVLCLRYSRVLSLRTAGRHKNNHLEDITFHCPSTNQLVRHLYSLQYWHILLTLIHILLDWKRVRCAASTREDEFLLWRLPSKAHRFGRVDGYHGRSFREAVSLDYLDTYVLEEVQHLAACRCSAYQRHLEVTAKSVPDLAHDELNDSDDAVRRE